MTSSMTYTSLVAEIQSYLNRNNATLVAQIPSFIAMAEIRCAREVKNLGFRNVVTATLQAGQSVYLKPARWLETVSINIGTATKYATVSRESAAGLRTITLDKAHNISVGDPIHVFGMAVASYNGSFTVSAITQYSVSYTTGSLTESETADTGGTVTGALETRTPLYPRSYEYCNSYWEDRTETDQPKFYADYQYQNFLIVPTPDIDYPFELVYFQRLEPLSETNPTNWLTDYARDLLLYACLLETAPYLKDDPRISTWKDYYLQAAAALNNENKGRVNDASIQREET